MGLRGKPWGGLLRRVCSAARLSPNTRPRGRARAALVALAALTLAACATTAPVAERRPTTITLHGAPWTDDYAWLREREDPAVRAYLEAENRYAAAVMAPEAERQEALVAELLGFTQQDDETVPTPDGPYSYYLKTKTGLSYPMYYRVGHEPGAREELLLDQNELARGLEYLRVNPMDVSPDHRTLAYGVDPRGDERATVHFRALDGRASPTERLEGVAGGAWSADGLTYYYLIYDDASRPYQLRRHRLGADPAGDVVVWTETDEAFHLSVELSRSQRFVLVRAGSATSVEWRALDARAAEPALEVVVPRQPGVEYELDHAGEAYYLLTNAESPTFELFRVPVDRRERAAWTRLVAGRPEVTLEAVEAFQDFVVLHGRSGGLSRLWVQRSTPAGEPAGALDAVELPEASYEVWAGDNREFSAAYYRFGYSSGVTPTSVIDWDVAARQRTVRKTKVVPGYDPARFATERVFAPAADGTQVPISLTYRRDVPRDGRAPLLLQGYGAYGVSYDSGFSVESLPLLERGVVVAIAHVRGGGELGRAWKDGGKLAKKPNTFSDFIAAAEHLVRERWTSPARLAITGGSAGGLLIGAVLNQRPDLFRAAVAEVPFVDVINTMRDETIPLTVIEWEEWGNPSRPEDFVVMRSYSPYDNVRPTDYPWMLVRAGWNDPRVGYWEPAKWVARLRATRTGDSPLLLSTQMGAGHGGASGLEGRYRQVALDHAFVLRALDVP